MTGRQEVTAALFVDLGEGREDKKTGLIRWSKQPRAKYECVRCQTTEGPVHGPDRVREFVARIRTDHPTYCTANQQGATA